MATAAQEAGGDSAPEAQGMIPREDAGERLVTLDFIRGLAVMGILFCNIVAFAHPWNAYFWPNALVNGPSAADKGVWLFQHLAFDGKFRGLFTLLFGASMMLFMQRAWARGATRWLQARRLAWLALFGLAHHVLLWRGDILFLYAVWGLAALLFVRMPPVRLVILGAMLAVIGSLVLTGFMGQAWYQSTHPEAQAAMAAKDRKELLGAQAKAHKEAAEDVAIYTRASYPAMVRYHAVDHGKDVLNGLNIGILETLPLMLLGMGLFGLGFFSGELDRSRMRRWGWIGLIGGAALSLPFGVAAWRADFPFHLTMFAFMGGPQLPRVAMVIGLAALLSLWAPSAARGWLGERVVAAGRMAFSNYLGASLVMASTFNGWGLGLYGKLHRVELIAVVLTAWAMMLIWSPWWLARFRFGPLEWAWRCLRR